MIESSDDNGPLIKIGGHFQRSEIESLDKVWSLGLNDKEIDWGRGHTLRYLREIGLRINSEDLIFHSGYSCVYSLTRTEVPYITQIPDQKGNKIPNLAIMGGLSGVGAKGALAYGELVSHLINPTIALPEGFQIVKEKMGYERLEEEIRALE